MRLRGNEINPVKRGTMNLSEHWSYSSAISYMGLGGWFDRLKHLVRGRWSVH